MGQAEVCFKACCGGCTYIKSHFEEKLRLSCENLLYLRKKLEK